jgi:hypothetical protein
MGSPAGVDDVAGVTVDADVVIVGGTTAAVL